MARELNKLKSPVVVEPKTLEQVLAEFLPELMKQWQDAPWDYKIFSPLSLDDAAHITVYLDFGKDYRSRSVAIELSLSPAGAKIMESQEFKKPLARKSRRN